MSRWLMDRYLGLVLPPNETPNPASPIKVAPASMFHRMRCYRPYRHRPLWLRKLIDKKAAKRNKP